MLKFRDIFNPTPQWYYINMNVTGSITERGVIESGLIASEVMFYTVWISK